MTVRYNFIITAIFALTASAAAYADTANCSSSAKPTDIVGVWRLVEASTTLADGTVQHPYGNPPAGIFIYTPGGHFSLHLNKNPPPDKFTERPTNTELGAVAREYIGYYGTWSVAGNSVTHHIEGAMLPNRIGQDAERPFNLCGDELELDIQGNDGRRFYRRLERVETFSE